MTRPIITYLVILTFLFINPGCSKSGSDTTTPGGGGGPAPTLPVLAASNQGNIGRTYIVLTGNISSANTGITARGFCWSTSPNPTLANSFLISSGNGVSFTDSIKGLTYNTTYYARAYATNSVGTSYSAELQFRTQNSLYTQGQLTMGGKIFYIDSTGEHGFIYAPAYNYTHYRWAQNPYNNILIGGTSQAVGSGQSNTLAIIAAGNNAVNSAAMVCDQLVLNGYSDWYLPSSGELGLLRSAVSIFDISGSLYWTSSEATQYYAYLLPINATASFGYDGKDNSWGVIPVRSF